MENIANEPVQELYTAIATSEKEEEETLGERVKKEVGVNLRRMKFIILKDNIEVLDKRNYFHECVQFITAEAQLAIDALKEVLNSYKLPSMRSSSSINTEDV